MGTIYENLYLRLEQLGFKARIVTIQHVYDLQNEIETRHTQGFFDEEFYQERMKFYQFTPPQNFPPTKSVIVIAVPRPQTPVTFSLEGKRLNLILPPTYSGYCEINRSVGNCLNEILSSEGYRVVSTELPLKLLAVRSGLAKYGRNNICFITGLGSFFQLCAYYSDLPCQEETWLEACMMDRCKNCRACTKICPTSAIATDRFLLHAERCLVFHNERSPSHPFPSWINPGMHNSLIGCMLCQQICPEDKPFLGWFEDSIDFSDNETALILEGTQRDQLPVETLRKLEQLELIDDLDKLPRNLGVFLEKNEIRAPNAGGI